MTDATPTEQVNQSQSSSPIVQPSVHCVTAPKLNFACHQSAFAFLRELHITNNDPDRKLDNIRVSLTTNPPFLNPKTWDFDQIAPGATMSIADKDRDVELDGGFLLKLNEAVHSEVSVEIKHNDEILCTESHPVKLLAHNEWGGGDYMPALLAAFSTPNDSAIDRILHDASVILRAAGKPDGIDGYQSGSRQRVWEIASAIYAAIANLGLTYSTPMSSFERNGQKIRLPNYILSNKVATCLDTTMLFCSVLEQAHLNPIVAMPEGHAVAGVWLQPEDLSDIVTDDAQILRKRIQLDELILIETTAVTHQHVMEFSKAVQVAAQTITPDKDETFVSAVDIRRARSHQINPLSLETESTTDQVSKQQEDHKRIALEEAPPLPNFDQDVEEQREPDTPLERQERWQRKLLDLTARNPLLNHSASKTSLCLVCPKPALFEDTLAKGLRISLKSMPKIGTTRQDEKLHQARTGEGIAEHYAIEALGKRQVLVDLPKADLDNRSVVIYRQAQTALQEGGSNTLFLALGFLLWRRDEKVDRVYRAPLILLPVVLERKSVRSGIKMLAHDDEPRFNTTLLEMLRTDYEIDIRGLDDELPKDHSGLDVDGIWNKVRSAIKDAPGFEVVEDVVLGHFSFAKYLMWKDLADRTDTLRNSPIVNHLLDTPQQMYTDGIDFVRPSQIDKDYQPSDLLVPLPTDSSQLAAIATADKGKNFIIIGPPGTGKSQTISNLIAHMLGRGKTVLFVSEKIAALTVVYKRLCDIGLGKYCLELHSNKASKKDVLKQLDNALNSAHPDSQSQNWDKKAKHLKVLRDKLNGVVERLHMPRRNGMTAHYAIGKKIKDQNLAMQVELGWPSSDDHDEQQLEQLRQAVKNLRNQASESELQHLIAGPLRQIEHADWSPDWQQQIVKQAKRLAKQIEIAEHTCAAFGKSVDMDSQKFTLPQAKALANLAKLLPNAHHKPEIACVFDPNGDERLQVVQQGVKAVQAYCEAQAQLSCPYEPYSWRKLDGDLVTQRYKLTEEFWWLKRLLARRKLIGELRAAGAQGKPDPAKDGPALAQLRRHGQAIDKFSEQLTSFQDWTGHETNSDAATRLMDLCKLGLEMHNILGAIANDMQQLANLRGKLAVLVRDNNNLLGKAALVGNVAQQTIANVDKLCQAYAEYEDLAGTPESQDLAGRDITLEQLRQNSQQIVAQENQLRIWCQWRECRTQAMDLQLAPLVQAIEHGDIKPERALDAFESAYCAWWSSKIITEDKVLRTFSAPEHNAAIEDYRELDDQFQKLTADYIDAELAGRVTKNANDSSWGILNREIIKKGRHKPVRKLLKEIPDVLTTLAPCMMMSPLSVAQYLPAEQNLFDVVIFDEASQITVWDAVGSLARGKQAIVAGDPKQMPPTNFFNRTSDLDEGIDVLGDQESILDEMLSAGIPTHKLALHYRSRRESLIAFSNHRYYGNELITFPAPMHPDKGVSLIKCEGFYARGTARHNQGEAEAIVAEILRRLTHTDATVRNQSIGVVTFNTEQQSLIENLLDIARSNNPKIEWAFASSCPEPVFIKNLETVQGDERDVILFSITYGPDQSGRITMNFGPLNRGGGERRLNVAMTRSRLQMQVFSTLDPEQIDLSRTSAQAVRDLKDFLQYARSGQLVHIVHQSPRSVGDFESPFEVAVAQALRDNGWQVHPQIGVSAYRIDLGIVHPNKPGVYLAGVECDGAMYHSSAVARERDKIRQQILEGLGWKLCRIWSTEWWNDSSGQTRKVDDALQKLLEQDNNQSKAHTDNPPAVTQGNTSLNPLSPKHKVNGQPFDMLCPKLQIQLPQ